MGSEMCIRDRAIQMIIHRELGLNLNQNPLQGAFIIEALTDLVEQAVYKEFDRLSERGGVIGAMETFYQRNKIQEESLYYESKKNDGSLPIVGVNTFTSQTDNACAKQLVRSTEQQKQWQLESLKIFKLRNEEKAKAAILSLIHI